MKRRLGLLLMMLFCVNAAVLDAAVLASGKPGDWLANVPEKDQMRVNPLADDGTAAAAGAELFAAHCVSCHGETAEGRGRRPGLRTGRVHNATDGELQWLLRNSPLAHGMPAWSQLPEVQRWQLVRFLHELPR